MSVAGSVREPTPDELWPAIRAAANAAGMALAVSRAEGHQIRNVFLNDAAVELLGYPREELLDRPSFANIAPEEHARLAAMRDARLRGEPVPARYDTVIVRGDGRRVPITIAVGHAVIDGQALWITFFFDVTERKEVEAHMAKADRLAALGMLAAGVAHELNNPLAFTRLHADALARELARLVPDVERRGLVDALLADIRLGLDRASTIVRDLRTFSRFDDDQVGPVDLVSVIDRAERLASPELRSVGRVVREVAPLPMVEGNSGRLEQVLVNLLVNAAQALPAERAGNEVVIRAERREGGWVALEVQDNGAGISAEDLPRVFDPFFTTKEVGVGTGLGLAVCHSIVTRFGGTITVTSERGAGTRVTVRLREAVR